MPTRGERLVAQKPTTQVSSANAFLLAGGAMYVFWRIYVPKIGPRERPQGPVLTEWCKATS